MKLYQELEKVIVHEDAAGTLFSLIKYLLFNRVKTLGFMEWLGRYALLSCRNSRIRLYIINV